MLDIFFPSSGLDPAGFGFESKDPSVRLDKTDALFVDVIHTDGQPILTFGRWLKKYNSVGDSV